jgi:hypothetical protein
VTPVAGSVFLKQACQFPKRETTRSPDQEKFHAENNPWTGFLTVVICCFLRAKGFARVEGKTSSFSSNRNDRRERDRKESTAQKTVA